MKTILFAYRVSDLERSLPFYRALGYTQLGDVIDAGDARLVWLKLPDESSVSLELVHRPADGPVGPGGFQHLAIDVGTLGLALDRLRAAGLTPSEPELPAGPDGPKTAWLVDPDGYRIELVEWPAGAGEV
ncbi:VOC family protein [Kribbella sp. NPDC051770]|uniref:VOC family protein n=1 Tax=Kribbella sp. NPDC051770 TaxID=3155413 RepID=UPI0034340E8E